MAAKYASEMNSEIHAQRNQLYDCIIQVFTELCVTFANISITFDIRYSSIEKDHVYPAKAISPTLCLSRNSNYTRVCTHSQKRVMQMIKMNKSIQRYQFKNTHL